MNNMECKICSSTTQPIFNTTILNKYSIQYFACDHCRFIQTEKVYWLDEAYSSAISSLDVGYVTRNIMLAERTACIIKWMFQKSGKFLDFGGGYGMFARMMRDKGFSFYRQDLYCENKFADFFDISDLSLEEQKFELLTSFEVFEHLDNPLKEIEEMFKYSDSILFSTELQPSSLPKDVNDWWYFMPQSGQHIAFYSVDSLKEIAKKFGANVYSNNKNIHLITKRKFSFNYIKFINLFFDIKDRLFLRNFHQKNSLIKSDFEKLKTTFFD